MRLNAGCGAHHPPGWYGVDMDPGCKPDLLAGLGHLPLEDRSCSRIFASHVFEHLPYWDELPAVLAELRRVLAPDGELCVVGPDVERAVLEGEPRQLLEQIVAWPDEYSQGYQVKKPPIAHAWTPSHVFMSHALSAAGFTPVPCSGKLGQLRDLGWPVINTGDWQHGYVCSR